jgi:hypothetical protein
MINSYYFDWGGGSDCGVNVMTSVVLDHNRLLAIFQFLVNNMLVWMMLLVDGKMKIISMK